jgi:uncharacterized protein YecT (DUF1311 family)
MGRPNGLRRARLLLAAILLAAAAQAQAESPDCEASAPGARLPCLEERRAKVDGELRQLAGSLRQALDAPAAAELQQSDRQWGAYRDWVCSLSSALENPDDEAEARVAELTCLIAFTRSRLGYLRRAFPPRPAEGVDASGGYDDGLGGALTLTKQAGARYRFKLEVVRGPTHHTGEVEGELELTATDTTAAVPPAFEGGAPCLLRFSRARRQLKVVEGEGCLGFHGMRASFNGTYRLLDP